MPRHPAARLSLLLALPLVLGCHKHSDVVAAPPKPKPPPTMSDVDLKLYKPNEAGAIMIIMYHRILAKEKSSDLNRPPEEFRKDLEELYKRNYRPVTVSELISNKMDVPAGKTPVAITFDDALPSQFKVITGTDGQAHIDPDCAVGIMETFNKEHKDWPVKATFFVLPQEGKRGAIPFGQPDSIAEKFDYLVKHGCEVANHTSTHPQLNHLSADKVQWEIATAVKDIKTINPAATMDVLALPYGTQAKKDCLKYLREGESGGTTYHMKAVLRAAWRPVMSPISRPDKKDEALGGPCSYNQYALERVKPDSRAPKTPGTLEYWLAWFEDHPNLRYVSDGNPDIVAVPKSRKSLVDEKKVAALGERLQLYSLTSGGAAAGGGLSVQQ